MASQIEDPPYGAGPRRAARGGDALPHDLGHQRQPARSRCSTGPKDWEWIAEMWCYALLGLRHARAGDSVFFAFSYGTFVGFWGAHYAARSSAASCCRAAT